MKERLPGFVLADLYRNFLVDANEPAPSGNDGKEKTQSEKIYYGSYEKKIVLLISDSNNIYLNDEHLIFLKGILNACKIDVTHTALINYSNQAINFQYLKKELQPEILLSFGISALDIELPFAMPYYQVQDYAKCKIVIAPSLAELHQQTAPAKAEKTKLWKSLQKLFNLG